MDKKPIRILIIEDNPGDVRLIRGLVEEAGNHQFQFEYADRLSSGLENLSKSKFDVILLDLGLPDSEGLHTLDKVLSGASKIPIVTLTGSTADEMIGIKAIQGGAQDYLTKDQLNINLLIRSIRYAIERKQIEEKMRMLNESLEKSVADRTSALTRANEVLQVKIAELQYTKNKLAEAHTWLSHLINAGPGVIYSSKPSGDFGITFVSNTIKKLMGYEPHEFTDNSAFWITHVHPEDVPYVLDEMGNAAGKGYNAIEYRFQHKDGIYHWIRNETISICDIYGKSPEITGFWVDITERKNREVALQKSKDKYRMLLDNLPQKIFYKDRNSTYISCNESFARDLHIKLNELQGKTDYDLFPKELADKYRAGDKRIMESGQTEEREEKYCKDGKELIVHSVKTPLKDESGRSIGILGIFWDVTEKVALEEEAILNRQLAALGELAAGIGHEINNPVMGIINYAQILANESKEKSMERDMAYRIMKEGDRIANIVKTLLHFARPGSKRERHCVGINEILSDTLLLSEAQLRKEGIRVKLNISPNLPYLPMQPQQIQQAFLNAISNARYALNQKYPEMNNDKILEILGEKTISDNCPHVKITFYDHGTGIPAAIREKVLDPFFTTKPRGTGTGLGLSISHNIIKDHGGKLLIDSIEGEYTKITFILPVSAM